MSYDELLSGSLGNLDKTVSGKVKRNDFSKTSHTPAMGGGVARVFASSDKSRQWVAGGDNTVFEGLFAQRPPPSATPINNMGDDSFGEFQSVPVVQPSGPSSGYQQVYSSSSSHAHTDMTPHTALPHTQSPQVVHTPSFNNPVMTTGATPPSNGSPLPHWAINTAYPLPQIYTTILQVSVGVAYMFITVTMVTRCARRVMSLIPIPCFPSWSRLDWRGQSSVTFGVWSIGWYPVH